MATVGAVERFARADPVFAVTAETWDCDPWLLGTPRGTVDLRTGRLRDAMQRDYITKATAVPPTPTADCPQWLGFLKDVTRGNEELSGYVQRFFGYSLTGVTTEHAILFIYGAGNNGKSVLLETISNVMADYAKPAPMETFLQRRHNEHPTELAGLHGARLVTASETEKGRVWNEALIKQATGGDKIAARFMRQDYFSFLPQFKLAFIGNHKPILRDVSTSTRRRFNLVPFDFQPNTVDQTLTAKFRPEYPGILRWLINGCLDWQRDGLRPPNVVRDATDEYFAEQDILGRWLAECCDTGKKSEDAEEPVWAMFDHFIQYGATKEEGWSRGNFVEAMKQRGYTKKKSSKARYRDQQVFTGIMLVN